MALLDVLLGRPLSSDEARAEKIGVSAGIPIFGLDALSSAAYGPEAALTLLIPLGAAGIATIVPVSFSILALLLIVYFSYRQTIAAYPGGGGSYTVARQNLGSAAGLLAGASLMIDYVLTAAVVISAVPPLESYTLPLCLVILVLVTFVNLRGVREAGAVFLVPTYLFIGCLLTTLGLGVLKAILSGGHPSPVIVPPRLPRATEAVGAWLLLKAFSSGCTAMTGVEAVSNGVRAFREPTVQCARRTLTAIIAILIVMLAGIAYLVRAYGIGATAPGQSGYRSVLSMLTAAVAGQGVFYYVTMASILLVLSLSANTAFADFPRLFRAIAENGYLPWSFAERGRRLVYSQGIYALAILAGALLIFFGGVTDRLIPLFAVGAFMAFTLSQAGMVAHWKKTGGSGARRSMFVNGLGSFATAITVGVVLVAKFVEGAWVTILLIPGLLILMHAVHRHYRRIAHATANHSPLALHGIQPPLAVVPILRWSSISKKALEFALTISREVTALHVSSEEDADLLHVNWSDHIEKVATENGIPAPKLVILPSPYRFVLAPILDYIREMERNHPRSE